MLESEILTPEQLKHLGEITRDRFAVLAKINPGLIDIQISSHPSFDGDFWVRGMVDTLVCDHEVPIDPGDWWQAVKERWFPGWVKRRWSIKKRVLVVRSFCPHLPEAAKNNHIDFLQATPSVVEGREA